MKATLKFDMHTILEIALGALLILFMIYIWINFGGGKNPFQFNLKVVG